MGSEFHRLVMAALAAGLLVIPGCGAGDGKSPTGSTAQDPPAVTAAAAPKIVTASITGTSTLHLTFSEAVAPATGVDPSKFRLTVAYYTRPASTATSKYSYAYYSQKYGYAYGGVEHTVYSDIAPVSAIAVDATSGTTADLQLGAAFDLASECQEVSALNTANKNAQAGLYLHYAAAGSPTIQDLEGNKLQSIADYWATDATVEQISGDFAGKPIPVSITCQ